MTDSTDAQYRLKVAQGFLDEARQDVDLGRWRSAVDSGSTGAGHRPDRLRRLRLIDRDILPREYAPKIWKRFVELGGA
jgi:hypothetical protein